MRQSLVNRSVLALSGVFVGACIVFAWVVEPGSRAVPDIAAATAIATAEAPGDIARAADVAAGARLYEMRCERCHTLEESLAPLLEAGPGTDARAAYLTMLQRHRKSSAEENGPITDYLQSRLDDAARSAR
jgi:mono/diheme cytochrome c family protein